MEDCRKARALRGCQMALPNLGQTLKAPVSADGYLEILNTEINKLTGPYSQWRETAHHWSSLVVACIVSVAPGPGEIRANTARQCLYAGTQVYASQSMGVCWRSQVRSDQLMSDSIQREVRHL